MKRIFTKDDFKTLKSITSSHQSNINLKELNSMNAILATAQILEQEKASEKFIKLNAKFEVLDEASNNSLKLMLTLPHQTNIKENKISVFSPLGFALIGQIEGNLLECKLPNGIKKLKVLNAAI